MTFDLVALNGTIVTPRERRRADLGISGGRIAVVASPGQLTGALSRDSLDAAGLVILPGLIDEHVHLYDPGWPEWEDFPSGTRAAAAGGVTTILEMPNSVPATDSGERLAARRRAVERRAIVDFGLYGGLGASNPNAALGLATAGAIAFKTFRVQALPGSEKARLEGGVRAAEPADMLERFRESAPTGLPHAVHVEDDRLGRYFTAKAQAEGKNRPEHHNLGRPELCEIVSAAETLSLAREARARVHLVHMSSPDAVVLSARRRAEGQPITVETCPQYLLFSSEDMARFGPWGKVHPPLRSPESRDRLWEFVNDGSIDAIATDHAPYAADEKARHPDDIWKTPAGHPGLETMLPGLLTQVNAGRLSLERLVALTSENPARIFGLYPQKGAIRPGADADLAVVDLAQERVLHAGDGFSQARATARWFDGVTVRGVPVMTLVRGTVVYRQGEVLVEPGHGRFLRGVGVVS